MLAMIVRNLIGVVLGFLALPSCVDACLAIIRRIDWRQPPDPAAMILGAVAGLLWMALRRPNAFVHTFIHELCHYLACVVLLVRVERFTVSNGKGGEVQYVQPGDPIRSTLIHIAPYVLPLVLLPVAAARLIVTGEGPARTMLSALLACCLLTHVHGLWHNLRANFLPMDGDIWKTGHALALALIAASLMLTACGTLWILWRTAPLIGGTP